MSKVIIKSTKNGINLILEENCDFAEIIADVSDKFSQSRSFFGKAKMALTVSGRKIDTEEEKQLINAISTNSDITILCIVSNDPEDDKIYLSALDMLYKQLQCNTDTLFLVDSLANKESIETENNVIIMGDVNPGCKIISGGNVVVFGGIYGDITAGDKCFVAGLDIQPERIHIGSNRLFLKKPAKWPAKPKYSPCIVMCEDDACVIKPLTRVIMERIKEK